MKNKQIYNQHKLFFDYNDKRLKEFQMKYLPSRCFIIGTGPSIEKTNLKLLKDQHTFTVNEFFRSKFYIPTSFYVVVTKEIPRYYHDICNLKSTLFMGGNAGRWYLNNRPDRGNPIILKDYGELDVWNDIPSDHIKNGFRGGGTVVFETLQLAHFMGFKEIYLLGCDCTYKGKHHCYAGKRWEGDERPWDKIFHRYEIIKKELSKTGTTIFNSTVGGDLDVFERRKLEDVIANV